MGKRERFNTLNLVFKIVLEEFFSNFKMDFLPTEQIRILLAVEEKGDREVGRSFAVAEGV